jgi:C1A family cysteine protease
MGRFVKGWIEDSIDLRDKNYYDHAYKVERMQTLPPSVDLRSLCPPVYDQGQLGSCTANAIAGLHEFMQMKQNQKQPFTPSRLMIYYDERVMEGTVSQDAGAEIRDGIKSVAKQGVCPELEWPYSDDGIQFKKQPLKKCYTDALKHQALSYQRVIGLTQMKTCLANGFPFTFGFLVYESFESQEVADTGVMPLPKHGEQMLGGHAIMAVGYDDASQRLLIRNSWGTEWAGPMAGYFTMPYSYAVNSKYCSDFWTIRQVE